MNQFCIAVVSLKCGCEYMLCVCKLVHKCGFVIMVMRLQCFIFYFVIGAPNERLRAHFVILARKRRTLLTQYNHKIAALLNFCSSKEMTRAQRVHAYTHLHIPLKWWPSTWNDFFSRLFAYSSICFIHHVRALRQYSTSAHTHSVAYHSKCLLYGA